MALSAAAIAGGMGLVGGLIRNSANASESLNNRIFQEQMSGTAYQRSTADMKAAGLNPMLAYSNGGASTPSGSMTSFENIGEAGARSASSAYSAAKAGQLVSAQVDTQKSQSELNRALTTKAVNDAAVSAASADKVRQDTVLTNVNISKVLNEVDRIAADTRLTNQQTAYVKQLALNALVDGRFTIVKTGNAAIDYEIKRLQKYFMQLGIPAVQNQSALDSTASGRLINVFRNVNPFIGTGVDASNASANSNRVFRSK